jgi:hypothetical protein
VGGDVAGDQTQIPKHSTAKLHSWLILMDSLSKQLFFHPLKSPDFNSTPCNVSNLQSIHSSSMSRLSLFVQGKFMTSHNCVDHKFGWSIAKCFFFYATWSELKSLAQFQQVAIVNCSKWFQSHSENLVAIVGRLSSRSVVKHDNP